MPLPIREEKLNNIAKKVYALYAKHGFDGISMDEISRQTGISKATLYHYFTRKEDIVRGMVDCVVSHLDSVRFNPIEGLRDVMAGIREFYVKSILVTALSGSAFLNDLKNKFPDCYEQFSAAGSAMQERFSLFYRESVDKGYFRDFPFALVSRQCMSMLPAMIDMDYLERSGLSLLKALREYYRMFFCQIFREEYSFAAEQEETFEFVDHLTEILLDDLFLDSIRR